jgi:hypothetical protein
MDITKIQTALDTAQKELNAVTDAEFKARRLTALRPLTLAAQAITLAQTHVAMAAARTAPKAVAEAAPAEGDKKK